MRTFLSLVFSSFVVLTLIFPAERSTAQDRILQELNQKIIEFYKTDKFKDALPLAEKYAELIKETVGEETLKYAVALNNIGSIQKRLGKFDKAE